MANVGALFPEDLKHFEAWYAEVLEGLYPQRNAGMVIAAVAFPLLERYIRQRVNLPASKNLNDDFFAEVVRLIPDIRDRAQANDFWSTFRNGLLHQVTLQLETRRGALPPAALTHDIDRIFAVSSQGLFILHPVLFAKRVIQIIRDDFTTFAGQVHIGPALPTVAPIVIYGVQVQQTVTVTSTPFVILGTQGRTRSY